MRNRWAPVLGAAALVAGAGWALAARPAPAPAPPPAAQPPAAQPRSAVSLPPAPPAWTPAFTPAVAKLAPRYANLPPEQADTAEKAVRAYLDTLAQAAHVPLWHPARGGSIGAEKEPYPRAYAYLHPARQEALPYADWLAQWEGVAHVGTVQVEPAGPDRFFVEVERMETRTGHAAISYHSGFFIAADTGAGWRLTSAELAPEDPITVPLGGHQPWRHDLLAVAAVALQPPPAEVISARAERRVVELTFRPPDGGPPLRARFARQMDGDWVLLERLPPPRAAETIGAGGDRAWRRRNRPRPNNSGISG